MKILDSGNKCKKSRISEISKVNFLIRCKIILYFGNKLHENHAYKQSVAEWVQIMSVRNKNKISDLANLHLKETHEIYWLPLY